MTSPFSPDSFPIAPVIPRAANWRLRARSLRFSPLPLWMGIVNVTPDSFSDGGEFLDPRRAIDHALDLVEQGADLLDIGGESTRPYSDRVAPEEELRRVIPVVEALASMIDLPLSIDTSKALVAREAMAAGAEIINDVTGLTGDPAMLEVAIESQAGLCVMHMQGTPQTMQDNPQYDNVTREIADYLSQRRDSLLAAGIPLERICLDPGIGFGKSHEHNLELMQGCRTFHQLGCPLLVGHSRKGFLGKLLGDKEQDRSWATLGGAISLARQGVQVIRLHEIRPTREALLAFAATGGLT